MDPVVMTLVLAVAVAAVGLVAWGIVEAWRNMLRSKSTVPLFGMLGQKGISTGEAAEALGIEAMAIATRRCALCASSEDCQHRVAAGEPPPVDCPNVEVFAGLRRPQA